MTSSLEFSKNWYPYRAENITPSDSVNLGDTSVVVALATGNIAAVDQFDTVIQFTGVPAGYKIPFLVKRVNATGTTAAVARIY